MTWQKMKLFGCEHQAVGNELAVLSPGRPTRACINFSNLTTAQASQRAREIGIRKTLSSSRRQLITQFLSETFLITVVATILSLLLTPLTGMVVLTGVLGLDSTEITLQKVTN
jgi:hypothetical protein